MPAKIQVIFDLGETLVAEPAPKRPNEPKKSLNTKDSVLGHPLAGEGFAPMSDAFFHLFRGTAAAGPGSAACRRGALRLIGTDAEDGRLGAALAVFEQRRQLAEACAGL